MENTSSSEQVLDSSACRSALILLSIWAGVASRHAVSGSSVTESYRRFLERSGKDGCGIDPSSVKSRADDVEAVETVRGAAAAALALLATPRRRWQVRPLDYHELERCTRVGYERGTRAPAANARQRTTFVAELSAENDIPGCPKAWEAAPPVTRF